jgi:hypothetical protein
MAKARRKSENEPGGEAAAPQSAGDTTAATLDRDRVAQRAYELYVARGCGEGQDLDDWLCAERELSGDTPSSERMTSTPERMTSTGDRGNASGRDDS